MGKSKKADEITAKCVEALMYPEELGNDAILVPVDVSGTKDFTPEHEELVKKLGAKAAVQCIVDAATLFKKSSKNFKKEDLPIQMTVADWRGEAGLEDDDDDEE